MSCPLLLKSYKGPLTSADTDFRRKLESVLKQHMNSSTYLENVWWTLALHADLLRWRSHIWAGSQTSHNFQMFAGAHRSTVLVLRLFFFFLILKTIVLWNSSLLRDFLSGLLLPKCRNLTRKWGLNGFLTVQDQLVFHQVGGIHGKFSKWNHN